MMMTEKRFIDNGYEAIEDQSFTDTKTDKTYYVDYFDEIIDLLNELNEENEKLEELLKLISRADSFIKEESVKEILRNQIRGIDTVTEYSAGAWHDYCILSNFFKKEYGEEWDDE